MTDPIVNEQATEQPETVNPVEVLRDEFRKEFDTLKASFTSQMDKLTEENKSLKEQNNDLQRALIRSATVPQTPIEKPKTEEELYNDRIKALAEKALRLM